jgi:hypothetical protein
MSEIESWFSGRIPADWFTSTEVSVDREEILVVGTLADDGGGGGDERAGRIARFRAETRDKRIEIAREAEHRFGRKVAWGAASGDQRELFTTLSVPVMTRLRQPERQVLDTLVEAGVARSRSHALAWCVRLVGEHREEWLGQLRAAMEELRRVREAG